MSLAIFNGSPRRKKSNSKILIDHFLDGYNSVKKEDVTVHYLASLKRLDENKQAFEKAETIIFIFPLYTDAMPAIVKFFFEIISDIDKSQSKNIGFIVQSGFPEAHHSVFLEKYLEKFSKRMNFNYMGTVIKGGVEGVQIMPPNMTKKLFLRFKELGVEFAKNGTFNEEIKEKLRNPYKLSKTRVRIFKVLSKIGITNFYWNSNLKKNNAFEKRFDKPYAI